MAAGHCEASVQIYHTTWRRIPQDYSPVDFTEYALKGKKVKFTLEHAMKAQGVSRGIAVFFLQPRR